MSFSLLRALFASLSLLTTFAVAPLVDTNVYAFADSRSVTADAHAREQIEEFVRTWFSGFDKHMPSSFFLERLSPNGFQISFPNQPAIENDRQFLRWLSSVDPLTHVKHKILAINLISVSGVAAVVKIRVDWSARDSGKKLFFPADQTWTLEKRDSRWTIKSYQVSEATKDR